MRRNRGIVAGLCVLLLSVGAVTARADSYADLFTKGAKYYDQEKYPEALKYLFAYSLVAADDLKQDYNKKHEIDLAITFASQQIQYALAIKKEVEKLGEIKSVTVVQYEGTSDGKLDAIGKKVEREKSYRAPKRPTASKPALPASVPDVTNSSARELDQLKRQNEDCQKKNASLSRDLNKANLALSELQQSYRQLRRPPRGRARPSRGATAGDSLQTLVEQLTQENERLLAENARLREALGEPTRRR